MTAPASEEKRPDVGVHGDTVTVIGVVERPLEYEPKTWTFDELRDLFPKSDGNLVRPLLDEVVALRAALAERTREREEYKRLYDHRGEALLRPCVSCGYQPKEIRTANATSLSRAKSDAAACAEAYLEVLKRWSDSVGGCPNELHNEGCPCDDTCDCPHVLPAHKTAERVLAAWAREEMNES